MKPTRFAQRRAAALVITLSLLLNVIGLCALATEESYTLEAAPGSDITATLNHAVKKYSSITIPAGSYQAETIYMNNLNGVHINGSGATIRSTSSGTGIVMRNSSNVSLNNLTLVGAGAHGILVDNTSGTFSNLTVKDSQRCGFNCSGTGTNATVNNCQFLHNGLRPRESVSADDSVAAGLSVYSGATVTATDCTFSDNVGSGVVLTTYEGVAHASTVNLYGALITSNGDHGVGAHPHSVVNMAPSSTRRCTVRNNATHGVMLMRQSSSSFLKGADLLNNGKTGLTLGFNSTADLVENCTMAGNATHGISVSRSSTLRTVSGCKVTGNHRYGVYVASPASVGLTGTRMNSNENDGLRVTGKAASVSLSGCTLDTNKWSGMVVDDGATATIQKTVVKNNKRYGLSCTNGTKTNITALTAKSNRGDGLSFSGSKCRASVKNSTISGNRGCGIVVQRKAAVSKLIKTKVTKNKKNGIAVYSKCSVGKTTGSRFTGNRGKQIYLQKGAKTKLKASK